MPKIKKTLVSKGTLNNYLRNIKVFFNFCFDNSHIKINPVVRLRQFKTTRGPKEDITDNDFQKLIKSIDTTTLHGHSDYQVIQWVTLLLFSFTKLLKSKTE